MPSLWKKALSSSSTTSSSSKGNRISRLVSDLQAPPKRGGSLVVETGFPTSLVDLFVKNRDRLKKPSSSSSSSSSSKKKKRGPHSSSLELPSAPLPPRLPSPPPPAAVSNAPTCSISPLLEEIDLGRAGTEIEEIKGKPGSNNVLLWAFKVAIVAILALCTKKLVLGSTMAAFLLLLIEYIGHRLVVFLLLPCSYSPVRLRSLCFWIGNVEREGELGRKQCETSLECEVEGGEGCRVASGGSSFVDEMKAGNEDSCAHIGEIIAVEQSEFHGDDACCTNEISRTRLLPVCSGEMEWKEIGFDEHRIESEVGKDGKWKRGKFWKKFVPNKMNKNKKKKGRDNEEKQFDEDASVTRQNEGEEDDNEVKEQPDAIISKDDSPSFPYSLEEEGIEVKGSLKEANQAQYGERGGGELSRRFIRNERTLKYMFMVTVALAGLLVSRALALVLTLVCCLVFKMARNFGC